MAFFFLFCHSLSFSSPSPALSLISLTSLICYSTLDASFPSCFSVPIPYRTSGLYRSPLPPSTFSFHHSCLMVFLLPPLLSLLIYLHFPFFFLIFFFPFVICLYLSLFNIILSLFNIAYFVLTLFFFVMYLFLFKEELSK